MNGDCGSYVVENIRCDDWDIEWDWDIEQNCQGDIDIVILIGNLVEKLNIVDEIYRDMVSIAWHCYLCAIARW